MDRARVVSVLSAAVTLVASGCGTIANMQGKALPMISEPNVEEPHPFGGVGRDVRWIGSVTVPYNVMFVADLPCSLVGDLVTLPKIVRGNAGANHPTTMLDRGQNVSQDSERSEPSSGIPAQ
jgi:uncharacterized protein YceK